MNTREFLLWEMRSRDTIDVKRCYVDIAGDLVSGVLLSQIIYWHLPDEQGRSKLKVHHDDHDWLAKKRGDWWHECRISPKQFDRAAEILEKRNLIITHLYRFDGSPTKHIRMDWDGFFQALDSLQDNDFPQRSKSNSTPNPIFPKGQNPTSSNGKLEIDERGRTITKTPAEITPETTLPPTPQGGKESVEEEQSREPRNGGKPPAPNINSVSTAVELGIVEQSLSTGEDKSSAAAVATRKQSNCLQDCRSGADVLEQLSNDPGILDCDPVPRTVLQEMQLRNWVWPWRVNRKTINPGFLEHRANQMPTSKNDQADMSPLDKARRNIINSERTVGGLILLATEFEAFASGAATATKRVNGHEPIRVDFQERFAQAQRFQMVEGGWFRDEIGQIRVRLFGGELVSQAKFMTLPLEKPKDLQTPEEARALLDQIRQYKQQAAQKLHNSRAKQAKAPAANVTVAPKPLVDNVVGLHDRRAEVALAQKLREISEELADPALLKDPLTQARAEGFVAANASRFRAVRGKDQLIIAIEEPTF